MEGNVPKTVKLPLTDGAIRGLRSGERVLLDGIIYTARDQAHMRLCHMLANDDKLPFEIAGATIYYTGPCPAKPGQASGPAGPTTSGRMDIYAPQLMDAGLKGMIGKGERGREVVEAMRRNTCVYFAAIGGAGALLAQSITASEVAAFPELGAEAIRKLRVKGFPATVAIDCYGNDLYKTGREQYSRQKDSRLKGENAT